MKKGALLVLAMLVAALAAVVAASQARALASPPVEVVVELASPPLVDAVAPANRATQSSARVAARLDLQSRASRQALARIQRDQAALEARIRKAIPSASVHWRYQVVLNGLAVVVPADRIGQLERLAGIARITRSVTYHRQLDTSPQTIGAPALWGADLSTSGQGTKIAVLDDGLTPTHPFFSPKGFTAPAGFPKGDLAYTSAKVIVARAFPPAGATWKYAAKPFDPELSEHGMHVAGIAAGDHGTVAVVGGQRHVLSGVAPGAYIGNYKVLTTPTPSFGLDGNSPEIAAGIEWAVRDGMDVINLSLGEPEIAPQRDLVVKALGGAARAGVVPVVAAGNDYDVVGGGSIDSPGTTPEAISVAAATESSLIADFSSAGPTPISLQLKPDVTAPGMNIFSSYPAHLRSWTSLSGTSMATPHVSGAAALLLQRHPAWTVGQIKSALTTTGDPVYDSPAKRQELAPTREGGGMVNLELADKPLIFVQPTSLSFGYVTPGRTVTRTVAVTDAGGGAGDWLPAFQLLQPRTGVSIGLPQQLTVPGNLTVTITASPTASEGESSGFIVLTGAGDRRIGFWLRVTKPRLSAEPRTVLAKPGLYPGSTKGKLAIVSTYRYPDSGPALGVPTVLSGPEQVFRVRVAGQVANFGVVVVQQDKGVDVYPRVMVAGDENRLTGMTALPVDSNPYRSQFGAATLAAGAIRPLPGLYDIVFDTPSASKSGPFSFRYWVNDTTPPSIGLTAPLPLAGAAAKLLLAITDKGAGVDPSSLVVKVDGTTEAATYDATKGVATVIISTLKSGTHKLSVSVADFQETKNNEDVPAVLPNTRLLETTFTAK